MANRNALDTVMEFQKPLYDTFRLAFVAVIRALRATSPTPPDTGPGSDVDIESRGVAHIGDSLNTTILQVKKALHPISSFGQDLWDWLFVKGQDNGMGGYGRIEAAASSGTDALRVTCNVAPETVDSTHTLKDTAGNSYKPNESHSFTFNGETYDFNCVSITKSAACNLEIGEELEFDSPPSGIDPTADIVAPLRNGRDQQTEPEGRTALIDLFRNPACGGNWPEVIRIIESAVPNTIDAFIWYGRQNYPFGWGCIDIIFYQKTESGSAQEATTEQIALVDAKLEEELPEWLRKETRTLTASFVKNYLESTFVPAAGTLPQNLCDWDAENAKRTVDSIDKPNKTITVNAVYTTIYPTGGDKCIIAGEEVVVDDGPGEGGNGMDEITFTTWPSSWDAIDLTDRGDTTGFSVLSGGGQVFTTLDALQTYVDALGPARGQGTPAPKPGWQDRLIIALLDSVAATALEGADLAIVDIDTTINGATSDVAPTYDSTGTVEMLIAPEIAVWEDKTNV